MIVICFQITTPYPRVPVPAGIEPATLRLTAVRSNQLSYRTRETFVSFLIQFSELKMKIKIAVCIIPPYRCEQGGVRTHAALASRS